VIHLFDRPAPSRQVQEMLEVYPLLVKIVVAQPVTGFLGRTPIGADQLSWLNATCVLPCEDVS